MNNFRTYQMALTNANLFHYNADSSVSNFEIVIPGTIADFVNAIWKYQPNRFMFYGIDQYGNTKTQTPRKVITK